MDLVISVLAVYYILTALFKSAGPWNVFSMLIRTVLPNCSICMAFWISVLVVGVLQVLNIPYACEVLAAAGGATLLYTYMDAYTAVIEF